LLLELLICIFGQAIDKKQGWKLLLWVLSLDKSSALFLLSQKSLEIYGKTGGFYFYRWLQEKETDGRMHEMPRLVCWILKIAADAAFYASARLAFSPEATCKEYSKYYICMLLSQKVLLLTTEFKM
jgi:hypothetical protein